jgi:hypothetical protein
VFTARRGVDGNTDYRLVVTRAVGMSMAMPWRRRADVGFTTGTMAVDPWRGRSCGLRSLGDPRRIAVQLTAIARDLSSAGHQVGR